jgi:hypothetical protein
MISFSSKRVATGEDEADAWKNSPGCHSTLAITRHGLA